MRLALLTASFAIAGLLAVSTAQAQFDANDLVIGVNSNSTDSFRQVRADGAIPGVDLDGGTLISGGTAGASPWEKDFIQTVEFDNAEGMSHNAAGNLLGGNFGSGWIGFEVLNFATDGSGDFEVLWNIQTATGGIPGVEPGTEDNTAEGVRSERGGGLSVSPNNSRIAWGNYDAGKITVLDYDAGDSIGTGSGASITGWYETDLGDTLGNSGGFEALTTGSTQGTEWLDDDTVISVNTFGELVSWDVSGLVSAGAETAVADSGWVVEKTGIFPLEDADPTYIDIEYEPLVDPDHIVVSGSSFTGISTTRILVLDATTFDVVDSIDVSTSSQTGREIAYDADGNLYIGGFGTDLVSVIPDFASSIGSLSDNSSVRWFVNDFSASFTGLDVAITDTGDEEVFLDADFNKDGVVDVLDLDILGANFNMAGDMSTGDANMDGFVDVLDLDILGSQFNMSSGDPMPIVSAPEPAAAVLIALGLALAPAARRRS